MSETLRDLIEEEDDEINTEAIRSVNAWVLDGVPLMQRLSETLEAVAFACDGGDVDEIDGALDAARRALDDVEGHGIVID